MIYNSEHEARQGTSIPLYSMLRLYSGDNEEPLEGSKQRRGLITFSF